MRTIDSDVIQVVCTQIGITLNAVWYLTKYSVVPQIIHCGTSLHKCGTSQYAVWYLTKYSVVPPIIQCGTSLHKCGTSQYAVWYLTKCSVVPHTSGVPRTDCSDPPRFFFLKRIIFVSIHINNFF